MRAFAVRSDACPKGILLPAHFADDGTCACEDVEPEVGAYLAGEDVFSQHNRLTQEEARP